MSRNGSSKTKTPPSLGIKKPKGVDIRKAARSQTHALRSRSVSEDLLEDKSSDNGKNKSATCNVDSSKASLNVPLAGGTSNTALSGSDRNPNTKARDSMDMDRQVNHEVLLAIREILNVLICMAQAFLKLSQNNSVQAIELFENLPVSQYESGWVMCHIGQARYQLGEFGAADQIFTELR